MLAVGASVASVIGVAWSWFALLPPVWVAGGVVVDYPAAIGSILDELDGGLISWWEAQGMLENVVLDAIDNTTEELGVSSVGSSWLTRMRRKRVNVRRTGSVPLPPSPAPTLVCADPTCMPCSRLVASGLPTAIAAFGHE